jgi:N-acetylglutamate synthase-like GNAT family acetyltransferase
MPVVVRPATVDDARAILQVHFDAVHETARHEYEAAILDEWSIPITDTRVADMTRHMREQPDGEIMIVAECDGEVVGFGSIASSDELRAVYVSPRKGKSGVGTVILDRLEELAREKGWCELNLDASLNARAFYAKHGYTAKSEGLHKLRSGREMRCVHMTKKLS